MSTPSVNPCEGEPLEAVAEPARESGFRFWAVCLVALLAAPFNALWIVHMEGVRDLGQPTIVSVFYNVIFIIFIVTSLNHLVRRFAPRRALAQAELLVLYVMLSVLTSPAGLDTLQILTCTITGPYRFGTPESGWQELFFQYLPQGMIVSDTVALSNIWSGGGSLYQPENLNGVIGPMLRWWAFLSALWIAPLGLAVLFRRRWIESERLTFPIVHLPLEMTRPDARLFRSRLMWMAFGLAATIQLLNGLHLIYPAVPQVPVKFQQVPAMNLASQLLDRPWNAIGTFGVAFYPFIIGLALLLPMELPLSCVLFYFFFKAQMIFCSHAGLTQYPEFPYLKEQSFGGYMALLAFSIWAGRSYYRDVLARAVGLLRKPIDRGEPLSYRAAVLLFLAGAAYVVGVGVNQRMALWVSIAFFAQYFVMTCVVGRIRAEMGLPTHEMERLGPAVTLGNGLGKRILGDQNLTSLSLFFGFTCGIRNVPFPHQVEGLKLMERSRGSSRRLLYAMAIAVVVGVGCALWAEFHLAFENGFGARWRDLPGWLSRSAWDQLVGWINVPKGIDRGRAEAAIIGFVFYFGAMVLRTQCLWWPLHPAGFALSTTYFMDHMWFPFFIAFCAKWVLTRYGGHQTSRGVALFALGLILGDITIGCGWSLYGIARSFNAWQFWP